MNAQKQITALRNLLHKHNHSYYVLDSPTISDYDFDMKLKELQAEKEKEEGKPESKKGGNTGDARNRRGRQR